MLCGSDVWSVDRANLSRYISLKVVNYSMKRHYLPGELSYLPWEGSYLSWEGSYLPLVRNLSPLGYDVICLW